MEEEGGKPLNVMAVEITELQSAVVALQGQIADIMEILTELVNKL